MLVVVAVSQRHAGKRTRHRHERNVNVCILLSMHLYHTLVIMLYMSYLLVPASNVVYKPISHIISVNVKLSKGYVNTSPNC
jgi:hypothetical protein